jgi:hypothetical protein
MAAKQFEPLRAGHQLEIALQALVHVRAVHDHSRVREISHFLQGKRRAQHVLRELLAAPGIAGANAHAVIHREAAVKAAFAALVTTGYRPVVPVTAEQFADAKLRDTWISEKGMQVLQFWSDSHRETSVDMFVREPFPFDEEYARALVKPLGAVPMRFVSFPTLIEMKTAAGRAQDLIDIEHLKIRLEDHGGK